MRSETQFEPRVVIDEATFDFRSLGTAEIEDGLDLLNETINKLREHDIGTAIAPMWDSIEVLDGCELIDYLSRTWPSEVSRDTLVLASSLLGNCAEWSDLDGEVPTECSIAGADPVMALSVGYALSRFVGGRAVACLTFRHVLREGLLAVSAGDCRGEVYFFADAIVFKEFWRWRMRLENVDESDFFESGKIAFPALALHEDLSFRKFEGSYSDLRDKVIDILAVLNDHFIPAYRQANGVSRAVQAALGQHHFEVSMESVKTRSSEKLMKLRDVVVGDTSYRCEWHAKIEPHRNRIHFWVPSKDSHDRILVGIFVKHLET